METITKKKSPIPKFYFIFLELNKIGIKGLEQQLFSLILTVQKLNGNCLLSIEDFVRATNFGRSQIIRSLKKLQELNLIDAKKSQGLINEYSINIDKLTSIKMELAAIWDWLQNDTTTSGKMTLPPVAKCNGFVNKEERSKEETNNKDSLDIKDIDNEDFEL